MLRLQVIWNISVILQAIIFSKVYRKKSPLKPKTILQFIFCFNSFIKF